MKTGVVLSVGAVLLACDPAPAGVISHEIAVDWVGNSSWSPTSASVDLAIPGFDGPGTLTAVSGWLTVDYFAVVSFENGSDDPFAMSATFSMDVGLSLGSEALAAMSHGESVEILVPGDRTAGFAVEGPYFAPVAASDPSAFLVEEVALTAWVEVEWQAGPVPPGDSFYTLENYGIGSGTLHLNYHYVIPAPPALALAPLLLIVGRRRN